MEQRRLRLGDILDDYCPRERRVTNHAIVAMIDDDVKQTRCTTCDAEHPYKGGQAPRRRKKDTPGALYKEVLAGMPESEPAPVLWNPQPSDPPGEDPPADRYAEPAPVDSAPDETRPDEPFETPADVRTPDLDDGPVHRPLIRATLPRPEGQKDARPLPDFTARHAGGRNNGNFRGNMRMKGRGGANGNRSQGGQRFGRPGGQGRGPGGRGSGGGGFRGPQSRHGGRKRSR